MSNSSPPGRVVTAIASEIAAAAKLTGVLLVELNLAAQHSQDLKLGVHRCTVAIDGGLKYRSLGGHPTHTTHRSERQWWVDAAGEGSIALLGALIHKRHQVSTASESERTPKAWQQLRGRLGSNDRDGVKSEG